MASSFTYPKSLLHRSTEKQWFPAAPTQNETTPTLTILEEAEEAYQQQLADIVTPSSSSSVHVIGKQSSHQDNTSNRRSSRGDNSNSVHEQGDDVSTVVTMVQQQRPMIRPATLFWNRRDR
jgi:hypothetical protein